jgi:predicted methyltransferase
MDKIYDCTQEELDEIYKYLYNLKMSNDIHKYKLEFEGKIYNCKSLEDMSAITGESIQRLFKVTNNKIEIDGIKISRTYKNRRELMKTPDQIVNNVTTPS